MTTFEQFQDLCKNEQRRYIDGERSRMVQAMQAWQTYKAAMAQIGLHPLSGIEIENRVSELDRMERRIDADFADGPTMRFSFDQFTKKETAPMKARVVLTVEGHIVSHDVELENLRPFMEVRGYPFTKLNDNRAQRIELQDKPKFQGVAGPMWDGDAIRYECPETYRQMSK